MQSDPMLITGATGFIGGHFLRRALRAGHRPTLIVRADSEAAAAVKLQASQIDIASTYAECAAAPTDDFTALCGDICQPHGGLRQDRLAGLRGRVAELWHFAASLNHEERLRDSIYLHNVQGTRHMLELARILGCRRFVYISTAYTAGQSSGSIPERLHGPGTRFNNYYEQTKFEAEHEVAEFCTRQGIAWSIMRPSIVIGPYGSKQSGGNRAGFYAVCAALHRCREAMQSAGQPLRFIADASTTVNLVPVDWVAEDMLHIKARGFAGGPVHHLTVDECPTAGEALTLFGELLQAPIVLQSAEPEQPSVLERLIQRRLKFYQSYLFNAKRFERRSGPRRAVTLECAELYMRTLLPELAQDQPPRQYEHARIESSDGVQIDAFRSGPGAAPAVVLVNAYMMPVDFVLPLAGALRTKFQVVTWESRGTAASGGRLDLQSHVDDLQKVLDHYDIREAHLIGWCTGAQVALSFAAQSPERCRSLTLLNGAFAAPELPQTAFQRDLRRLAARASRSLEHAAFCHRTVVGSRKGADETRDTMSALLGEVDPAILHLANRPFSTPEHLHRYAAMIADFYDSAAPSYDALHMPVLAVGGGKDTVCPSAATEMIAGRLTHAQTVLLPAGDHYSMYFDSDLHRIVATFLSRCDAERADRRSSELPSAAAPEVTT
jgi:nucleoside-diphosphate-sugar epimerase/pimeloyl-ACP methyl ester carboxylesterase